MSRPIQICSNPDRILIIKPSSLGDVVHALPVLACLRRKFPRSHITWLVALQWAELLAGLPQLNQILLFDRRRLGSAWRSPSALGELVRLVRKLRDARFDLVLDLQGLLRSGWMSWQTGAPVRLGLADARELAWIFYTHPVVPAASDQHAVDRCLALARALGCDTEPVEFPLPLARADRMWLRRLFPRPVRYAVLLPGASWPAKRWPAERFASLVQPLQKRFGLVSVVAGGADAAGLAPAIRDAVDLTGKTTLPQLLALLEGADLVVANDSGPMHLAAAMGRPLVALFGPTSPLRTGPYRRLECALVASLDCQPCLRTRCRQADCLAQITPDQVLTLAERQLAGTCSSPRDLHDNAGPA